MAAHDGRSRWVGIWFALDGIVALAPPLYWWAGGRTTPILGVPAALFYFLAVDVFIAASLVAAYLAEPSRSRPSQGRPSQGQRS